MRAFCFYLYGCLKSIYEEGESSHTIDQCNLPYSTNRLSIYIGRGRGDRSSRGVLVRFVYTCRIVDQHCLYFFSHYISYQMSDLTEARICSAP